MNWAGVWEEHLSASANELLVFMSQVFKKILGLEAASFVSLQYPL